MDRPTVSVVIPAHDAAAYLPQAIDSVRAQIGGIATEIVVVDDGSKDETQEVLAGYGSRVRWVSQENAGPASARNHGARLARGRWLAFLDADDLWHPCKLARQLERAGDDLALVYTDRVDFGDGRVSLLSQRVRLAEGDVFEPLLLGNFITLSSVIMRRRAFVEAGGFCEELFGTEDYDLWLRHASRYPVGLCREPVTYYRRHPGGLSRDPQRMVAAHLHVVYRALSLPRCHRMDRGRIRRVLSRNWRVSASFAEASEPRWAMACYLRSLIYGVTEPEAYRGMVRCLARLHRPAEAPAARPAPAPAVAPAPARVA